jgi:hypothetical protein
LIFSAVLVSKVISETAPTVKDEKIPNYIEQAIPLDPGFQTVIDTVRATVNAAPHGSVVNFDNLAVPTALTSKDLATSIHSVTFILSGSITKTDNWSGKLKIEFSDPYDFDPNASDWKVRIFGRLYENNWLSKFNVTGKFKFNFTE